MSAPLLFQLADSRRLKQEGQWQNECESGHTSTGHCGTQAGDGIASTGYVWPKVVVGPRFGMAYDPIGSQTFVIRGGAGLFYDRPDGNTVFSIPGNPPMSTSQDLRNGTLSTLGTGLSSAGVPALSIFQYDAKVPASVQWHIGPQIALPWALALDDAGGRLDRSDATDAQDRRIRRGHGCAGEAKPAGRGAHPVLTRCRSPFAIPWTGSFHGAGRDSRLLQRKEGIMRVQVSGLAMGVALCASVVALQRPTASQTVPAAQANASPALRIYIRAGLKTHGPGQHDYPQYLADWSKILTERGAVVDGSLHFPTSAEVATTDVMVMYKGDAGAMTPEEKTTLETYLRRGGGLVSFHDTLCGPDPEYYSTIVGGAKKHGETNFTLEAEVPYTIAEPSHPIMQGLSNFAIKDEAFFLITWAKSPTIKVLATATMAATPSAKGHEGEVVPQIWTYERTLAGGQPYRAFVWMQGHNYENFANPVIQPMLLRGIAWAAKRSVDALSTVRQGRGRGLVQLSRVPPGLGELDQLLPRIRR